MTDITDPFYANAVGNIERLFKKQKKDIVLCCTGNELRDNVINLSEQGCKKILYLYDAATYSGNEKLTGYTEGCESCNIAIKDRLAVKVEHSVSAVEEKIRELIAAGTKIDAVMASEDILAAAAMNCFGKHGIKIPVIGFNNSIISECTCPSLTSVDNMSQALCETAVRLLDDIAEKKTAPDKTVISARLIERETFKRSNRL